MATTLEKQATAFTESTTLMDYMFTGNTAGAFRKIAVENVASELYNEMDLGTSATYDIGISGGVLVGNIGGEGVMRYDAGNGVHTVPENTAFNKSFGTTDTTVACGNHNHGGFAVKTNNVHMLTTKFTGVTSKSYTYLQVAAYSNYTLTNTISPAINVSLYSMNGSDCVKVADSSFTVTVTTREASTDMISLNSVTIGGLTSSKTYLLSIVFKDNNGFSVSSGT